MLIQLNLFAAARRNRNEVGCSQYQRCTKKRESLARQCVDIFKSNLQETPLRNSLESHQRQLVMVQDKPDFTNIGKASIS